MASNLDSNTTLSHNNHQSKDSNTPNNKNKNKRQKADNSQRRREIMQVLKKHHITRGISPEKLRNILEELGPTYVKLGQIMSMHSDILPKAYCDELMNLNSNVTPMPFSEVREVLEKSWNCDIYDILSNIEETPLGSASIAQVHKAVLKNGSFVVIKVQRKGIYDIMARDIGLLHHLASLMPPIGDLKNMVDLNMVLDEMWVVAQQEMDFLKEAANIVEFAHNNKSIVYVDVPTVYKEYTTDRVLVMEYIEGVSIIDRKTLEKRGYDCHEIGQKLVNNYIKQVMDDGFFHADPHPGNISIRGGQIIWLDMGMMGRLCESQRKIMARGVSAIALKDVNMLVNAVRDLCDENGVVDNVKLYVDLREFLQKYGSMSMGEINVPASLQDIMDIMKNNHLAMPHGVTMLARGLAHIEGDLAIISPDINMLEIATTRIGENFIENLDLKAELKKNAKLIYRSFSKGMELPALATDLLQEYLRGDAKTNLQLQISGPFAEFVYSCVRNLVIGMCLTGLLIGSAIICTTEMSPKIFGLPFLGFIGFLIASLSAVFLIGRYAFVRWKKKHFKRRFK